MKYEISPDRKTLTIMADEPARAALRSEGEYIHSDAAMLEYFDPLICNSELEWIDPADTGDLTSAPMLGILGEVKSDELECLERSFGVIHTGTNQFQPILERFAFMDYQVRSVLEDLRDTGKAVFTS